VIFPGVRVGDGCIVAPGAIVTRDFADGCVVAGSPARMVEKGVRTGKYGVRLETAAPGRPYCDAGSLSRGRRALTAFGPTAYQA